MTQTSRLVGYITREDLEDGINQAQRLYTEQAQVSYDYSKPILKCYLQGLDDHIQSSNTRSKFIRMCANPPSAFSRFQPRHRFRSSPNVAASRSLPQTRVPPSIR